VDVYTHALPDIWIQTDGDLGKRLSHARSGWKRRQRGQRTMLFILRTGNHTHCTLAMSQCASLPRLWSQGWAYFPTAAHSRADVHPSLSLTSYSVISVCKGNIVKRQGRLDKGGRESKNEMCRDQNRPGVRNRHSNKLLCKKLMMPRHLFTLFNLVTEKGLELRKNDAFNFKM